MIAENEAAGAQRRAVEALAQTLYETNDLGRVPWARRTRIVRDPWLQLAERTLSGSAQANR